MPCKFLLNFSLVIGLFLPTRAITLVVSPAIAMTSVFFKPFLQVVPIMVYRLALSYSSFLCKYNINCYIANIERNLFLLA